MKRDQDRQKARMYCLIVIYKYTRECTGTDISGLLKISHTTIQLCPHSFLVPDVTGSEIAIGRCGPETVPHNTFDPSSVFQMELALRFVSMRKARINK
jgi:hypothetical protein